MAGQEVELVSSDEADIPEVGFRLTAAVHVRSTTV